MPTDKFYIETVGGLGNRMRALDSAIEFCNRYDKELHLIWPLYKGMNCRFDQLFVVPDCISSVTYPSEYSRSKLLSNIKVAGRKLARISFPFRYDMFISKKRFRLLEQEAFEWSALSKNHKTRMQSDARFMKRDRPYAELNPIESLNRQIQIYRERFSGKRVVGVHIRRTDNVWSTESSMTESFVRKMDAELDKDSATVFFIATDSTTEESLMISRYGDRIMTFEKATLRRDSVEGIQLALIDLYILSSVDIIIGSYRSSFTDTAAEIGNIKFAIA